MEYARITSRIRNEVQWGGKAFKEAYRISLLEMRDMRELYKNRDTLAIWTIQELTTIGDVAAMEKYVP